MFSFPFVSLANPERKVRPIDQALFASLRFPEDGACFVFDMSGSWFAHGILQLCYSDGRIGSASPRNILKGLGRGNHKEAVL